MVLLGTYISNIVRFLGYIGKYTSPKRFWLGIFPNLTVEPNNTVGREIFVWNIFSLYSSGKHLLTKFSVYRTFCPVIRYAAKHTEPTCWTAEKRKYNYFKRKVISSKLMKYSLRRISRSTVLDTHISRIRILYSPISRIRILYSYTLLIVIGSSIFKTKT